MQELTRHGGLYVMQIAPRSRLHLGSQHGHRQRHSHLAYPVLPFAVPFAHRTLVCLGTIQTNTSSISFMETVAAVRRTWANDHVYPLLPLAYFEASSEGHVIYYIIYFERLEYEYHLLRSSADPDMRVCVRCDILGKFVICG